MRAPKRLGLIGSRRHLGEATSVRRGRGISLLIFPLYVAAALTFTWPLMTKFDSAIPSSRTAFDPGLQAFLIGWDWHSLTHAPWGVFHAPIFYPEPRTLTYMDHMLGETVLAAPAFLSTGSVPAAYNLLIVLSFAVSGWTTYRLGRILGVPRGGAFLSGILFAFSPYRFANLDLLNQLQTQFLPLGILFGLRYLRKGRLGDAAGAIGTIAAQVYFGWYYAYFLLIAYGLLVAYALAGGLWPAARRDGGRIAGLAALGLLAIAPVAIPYAQQHLSMPSFRRTLGEAALYSADVLDYARWNPSSRIAGLLRLPTGPQSYWPGAVTVGLAAAGTAAVFRGLRRREPRGSRSSARARAARATIRAAVDRMGLAGYFPVLAVVSFLLSLGPILQIAGQRIWIPLPYSILYFVVPGFSSLRAPARLAVLALLALTVLAGLGYKMLGEANAVRGRAAWRGIAAALIAVAGLSAWNHPVCLLEIPTAQSMPAIYRWLAAQPGAMPFLEFPVPRVDADESETGSLRQFFILYHRKPRLDGSSGFVSPRYREFRLTVQSFPGESALAAATGMGARWIVVHYGDYRGAERESLIARVAREPRLVPLAAYGDDAAYELAPRR